MLKIHDSATPIIVKIANQDVTVGWRVETHDFTFDAVKESDGTVNVYVEWGDDQPGDMSNHETWTDAQRWLNTLLKATQPEAPKVKIDLTKVINESVDLGMQKAGVADTPAARIDILNRMHATLLETEPSAHAIRPVLLAIEDQIIELQDQL